MVKCVLEAKSTHHFVTCRQLKTALMVLSFSAVVSACGEEEKPPVDPRQGSGTVTVKDCLPQDSAVAFPPRTKEVSRAKKLNVFMDGSQSMAGFNAGATGDMRPLGDLIALINTTAKNYESTEYFAFGKNIKAISADTIEEYGTVRPFNCRGSNCDNQESRLDTALGAAVDAGGKTLNLIVTDLWLDNKSFSGSPQVALGQPLRSALQNGMAIGVIGIMAPFEGAVYDIPGVGTYRGAKELPLYVLAIGPEEDVSSLQIALSESESPSFSQQAMRYSLFSAEPNFSMVSETLKPVGAGTGLGGALPDGIPKLVPQYYINLSTAAKQNGQLGKAFAFERTLREGLIWRGKPTESTNVWRLLGEDNLPSCGSGTWQAIAPLQDMWKTKADFQNATFSFDAQIGSQLRPGNVYYIETHFGSDVPAVPNPDNQWMRDWALDAATAGAYVNGEPKRFKTLNLSDLSIILEKELARRTPDGREAISFGFMLKVER